MDSSVPLVWEEEEDEWRQYAACKEAGNATFYNEDDEDQRLIRNYGATKRAKAMCEKCPVRMECLTYALDNKERFGIWGGLTARERRNLVRNQNRKKQ